MSYTGALARISELDARLGISSVAAIPPQTTGAFQGALNQAVNRFSQGAVRLNNPLPTGSPNLSTSKPGTVTNPNGTPRLAASGVTQGTGTVPADLAPVFARAAAANGVPVALAQAIARAESGFRADAVSGAGAQGMMQLMPATARGLGVTDPFDPVQSIEGGVKYLGNALRTFGGDVAKAVAAYNAGGGAVRKYGGVPPYPETQRYVQRVMQYAREYGLQVSSTGLPGGLS